MGAVALEVMASFERPASSEPYHNVAIDDSPRGLRTGVSQDMLEQMMVEFEGAYPDAKAGMLNAGKEI